MTNFISQHIQEEEKEFDKKFPIVLKNANGGIIDKEVKSFHRSSSLSLVEKIIGEVRGRKAKLSTETLDIDSLAYAQNQRNYGKNEMVEEIALLLEQGLEDLKDNK